MAPPDIRSNCPRIWPPRAPHPRGRPVPPATPDCRDISRGWRRPPQPSGAAGTPGKGRGGPARPSRSRSFPPFQAAGQSRRSIARTARSPPAGARPAAGTREDLRKEIRPEIDLASIGGIGMQSACVAIVDHMGDDEQPRGRAGCGSFACSRVSGFRLADHRTDNRRAEPSRRWLPESSGPLIR